MLPKMYTDPTGVTLLSRQRYKWHWAHPGATAGCWPENVPKTCPLHARLETPRQGRKQTFPPHAEDNPLDLASQDLCA